MVNGVWVIIWVCNDNSGSGIGGVFSTLDVAKNHIKDLFDEGEEIEEEYRAYYGYKYVYRTNYATYEIEYKYITEE